MARDARITRLADLADRKGWSIDRANVRHHVRLYDPEGRKVAKDDGSTAFSVQEAFGILAELPDRKR